MTTPPGAAGPSGTSGSGQTPSSGYGPGEMPPIGKPLSPNDPWVKMMEKMFPKANTYDLQVYAGQFRDNMCKMLQSEINRMTQKSHEAAMKMKRAIEGNE
ncbi:MAG: hypothetical protein JSR58_00190 [Verrucomicrobia bacterium]|nr:hypothetical protein [Verrucomicrobiota bacterium]